jgi:hypothetical protein
MRRPGHLLCLGVALGALVAAPELSAAPDPPAPAAKIRLQPLGSYREAVTVGGRRVCRQDLAEIVAYDPATRRLFVNNIADAAVDILDAANPRKLTLLRRVAVGAFGEPASVAVSHGLVAVAVETTGARATEPGSVLLLDTGGRILRRLKVGVGPDTIIFTPDGKTLLTADEGEPSADYTRDPEGSVSLIDLSHGPRKAKVRTAGFRGFAAAALRRKGVRVFGPRATAAQDLEPEDIAVAQDGRTAWVTLEENNALAIVDIAAARVTEVVALGTKDHARRGAGLDASDEDGRIHIARWPVRGMFQPDQVAAYAVGGRTYLVLANEGLPRTYEGFDETARVADLTLDPKIFPNAAALQRDERLGRLQVTTVGADRDGDGKVERLRSFGGRSFSIRRADGSLVFDSGDLLERVTARDAVYAPAPNLFNTPDDENAFDERSDSRGPEPEGVVVASIAGRVYAFVSLERASGVAVVDVTDPKKPVFQHYADTRDFTEDPRAIGDADPDTYVNCAAGDLGPEGLLVIPAAQSPTGEALLAVGFETSGSTRLFRIGTVGGPR